MHQPYGTGLLTVPEEFGAKVEWGARRALRLASKHLLKPLDRLGLGKLRIERLIWVKDRLGKEVRNYREFHPARTEYIAQPHDAEFVKACKGYNTGSLDLAEIFVCEIAPALYYPYLGLVANENFEVFGDSVLLPHRFETSPAYRSFRPRNMTYIPGPVSSIQRIDAYNFWHWFADCLPQMLTLEQYMQGEPLTLLMGDDLGGFQRETLRLMLPATFRVQFVPPNRWIRTDRWILPSYLSGRRHGYLPQGYYAEIRKRISKGLGLPEESEKQDQRIYLSRATSKRRRVGNEAEVVELLTKYGFEVVYAEKLSMRDQVDLFQRAEAIVAPHGAALGGMVFSTHAKLLVIYPEKHPGEYFYTMARSLGLEHHGLVHDYEANEDLIDNFTVDVAGMERMLSGPMRLAKR